MLNRIVIGTANWAQEYNGHKVSEKEQSFIMEYMKEVGIEWLDVATAYGTQDIGFGDFKRILKQRAIGCEIGKRDIALSHSKVDYRRVYHDGASIYRNETPPTSAKWIEIPYSILDSKLGNYPRCDCKLIARSIFCKGKALKYFSPRECIDFVLMNPRIDKVIIGVDSVDQLKDNIAHLVKMEKFTHNEEVDTRKF